MRVALQPAFVLHRRPYRNTSLLLEVFSRDHGRVGLVARGVRTPRSRLKGLLQPFMPLLQGGKLRQPMTKSLALSADSFVKLGLTGYDARYPALAKQLRGKWLTFDKKTHGRIEKLSVSFLLGGSTMPQKWP